MEDFLAEMPVTDDDLDCVVGLVRPAFYRSQTCLNYLHEHWRDSPTRRHRFQNYIVAAALPWDDPDIVDTVKHYALQSPTTQALAHYPRPSDFQKTVFSWPALQAEFPGLEAKRLARESLGHAHIPVWTFEHPLEVVESGKTLAHRRGRTGLRSFRNANRPWLDQRGDASLNAQPRRTLACLRDRSQQCVYLYWQTGDTSGHWEGNVHSERPNFYIRHAA